MAENTQVIIPQSPISKRTAEQFKRLHRCCFIGAKDS